jgi:hypothetical protein
MFRFFKNFPFLKKKRFLKFNFDFIKNKNKIFYLIFIYLLLIIFLAWDVFNKFSVSFN